MPRRAVSSVFRDVTLRSGTMPRKSIGERPMTDAERQARHRAARAADVPVIRARRPLDRRSRAQRWRDAVAELTVLQDQYAAWLAALPPGWRRCRVTYRTVPSPMRCRHSVISIS